MSVIKAMILGIIQGLTEFLPISSSGHLVIGSQILNFHEAGISFEIFLHCGTLVAVLIVFREELRKMLKSILVGQKGREEDPELAFYYRWNLYVVVATIPAVLVGLFLKDSIEAFFDNILITFAMLFVTGIIMTLAGRMRDQGTVLNCPRSFGIGVAQALAILPGLSRSGSTIFCGMLMGINRETAARFSFIMSIPAICGAMVLNLGDMVANPPSSDQLVNILVGTIASAISGYWAIILLMQVVRVNKLHWFGYYCFVVSAIGFSWYFLIR